MGKVGWDATLVRLYFAYEVIRSAVRWFPTFWLNASAVAFLLSDAASFITGVNLPVDGGYLAQ